MIRPAKKKEDLDYVIEKFKATNRFGISEKDFFAHLQEGIKCNTSGVYLGCEGEKTDGCLVVSIVHPAMVETPLLWIDFIYSDNNEVTRRLANAAENLARIHKIKKISGSMKRGSDAIIKRYGYKEDYIVISKEVT
jgi:hypothetical protein